MRANLLLLLAGLLLPTCSAFAPPEVFPDWQSATVDGGPPMRDMLQACNLAVIREHFPPGRPDLVDGRLESGWDVQLSPYSKRGRRSKAIVELIEDGSRNYLVKVHVLMQANTEKHQPLNPNAAAWEDKAANPGRARIVLEHILAQVRPRGRG